MDEKELNTISKKKFLDKAKETLEDVVDNKEQYVIEDENGKRALLLDFDEFMEMISTMEQLVDHIEDFDEFEIFDHEFDIDPVMELLSDTPQGEAAQEFILFNELDEELANAFVSNKISEEEFIVELFKSEFVPTDDFFEQFLTLDEELQELILEKTPHPDLIIDYFNGDISRELLIDILSDLDVTDMH